MAKRPESKSRGEPGSSEMVGTGLSLPTDLHALLQAVAFKRSRAEGGRASVSAVVVDLVRKHEKELKAEAGKFLALFS